MKNLATGAAHGASGADDRPDRAVAVGLLGSAAMWCGTRARGRDAPPRAWRSGSTTRSTGPASTSRRASTCPRTIVTRCSPTKRAGSPSPAYRGGGRSGAQPAAPALALDDGRCPARRRACRGTPTRRRTSHGAKPARLRHALRTHGAGGTDLDVALQEASEIAAMHGMSIELVTSELAADVDARRGRCVCAKPCACRCEPRPTSMARGVRWCVPPTMRRRSR